MAKKDEKEIKVGDIVFAEQGYEETDGTFRDVTGVVESIDKEGVVKIKSEEFDLTDFDFEVSDLIKKPVTSKKDNEAPKKKMTEVDSETLEKLINGYEKLQEKVKDLEGAADIGRLARIQAARNDGKLVKKAKVNVYMGKYVAGWVATKDDVYFSEDGRMHEDQQVKLYLWEGKDKKPTETDPMSYRTFARLVTKVEGEVVKESKDSDGTVSFKVLLPDGLEIELPIVFLN